MDDDLIAMANLEDRLEDVEDLGMGIWVLTN